MEPHGLLIERDASDGADFGDFGDYEKVLLLVGRVSGGVFDKRRRLRGGGARASLAADVERLERQVEDMASAARVAKREADHNKEQLASAYARDARVDELFAEAEKWRLAAEAAEEKRAAFEAEQSEKKAAFVRDAEARLAEAREAADAHEAEASRLREALDAERLQAKERSVTFHQEGAGRKEDVSARVRTLKSALAEKTAALARAERDALHLARVADQTAALASHGTDLSDMSSGDAVRAARLAPRRRRRTPPRRSPRRRRS